MPRSNKLSKWESQYPYWTEPPVRPGFWASSANRLGYMKWLGQRLGYRKPEDWYRITTDDIIHNHGGGVLTQYWHDSAVLGVMQCFPDYDWKEWLFGVSPRYFWRDSKNRRRYMKWLGHQLGYRRTADWYQVTNQDFRDHNCRSFLIYYNSTVSAAVMDYEPSYDWKEWLFSRTPMGFWHNRSNRQRYMRWLASKLGVVCPSDWYGVIDEEVRRNHGKELLRLFDHSLIEVVRDTDLRRTWHEWMFARVPQGFWDQPENRLRYIAWLGKRLKFTRPEDWSRIRRSDFSDNYGGGLLSRYRCYSELLAECIPKLSY